MRWQSAATAIASPWPRSSPIGGGGFDGVQVRDVPTGQLVSCGWFGGELVAVAISPDGSRVAVAGDPAAINVLDATTGKVLHALQGHTGAFNWPQVPVEAVAFAPDGRLLASGGRDHTVRLWDAVDGRAGRVFDRHSVPILAVAFSADGRWVASGGGAAAVGSPPKPAELKVWARRPARPSSTCPATPARCAGSRLPPTVGAWPASAATAPPASGTWRRGSSF